MEPYQAQRDISRLHHGMELAACTFESRRLVQAAPGDSGVTALGGAQICQEVPSWWSPDDGGH